MLNFNKKTLFIFFLAVFLFWGNAVFASESFYVDSDYDLFQREEIKTEKIETSEKLYFFVDSEWWEDLSNKKKGEVEKDLEDLGDEFDNNIYSVLTSNYGSEWKPGIDDDNKITVLIHPMRGAATGYFNNGNEYSVYQNTSSNEREMVYLDARHITDDIVASYLAHEMTHLITFNQKERLNNVQEEVWLNEARAEYAPTVCGYNDDYEGSYLKSRVGDFLNNPLDSITEWQGKVADYGALSMFVHYLADYYGEEILTDSIKSSKVGIDSINEALKENGFNESFSDIFIDWTIAVFVNDCSLGQKYCYSREGLKDLKVVPQSNYLPVGSKSVLSVFYQTKDWTGNWHKIFGGEGNLEFEFKGDNDVDFEAPYVFCKKNGSCNVDFLELNSNQRAEIKISDFGEDYSYLAIIPQTQEKDSGFNGSEDSYPYFWQAKTFDSEDDSRTDIPTEDQSGETKEEKLNRLLALMELVKARIAELTSGDLSCQSFNTNLYYGMVNNEKVKCLQQFLKNQGSDVYPEGLVTGNYLGLTRKAVIRFQEGYKDQILTPLGLEKGTGYFGPRTRSKANSML